MTEENNLLQPGEIIKPYVNEELAQSLIRKHFGLEPRDLKEFNSYDDKNYFFRATPQGETEAKEFILKVTNSGDSKDVGFFDGQREVMFRLKDNGFDVPSPIKNLDGSFKILEKLAKPPKNGEAESSETDFYMVRVLTFVRGSILNDVKIWTTKHFYQCGQLAGRVTEAMKGFRHSSYENRDSIWFLRNVPKLRDFLFAVEDPKRRNLMMAIIESFEKRVVPKLETLETGVIHGDLNEQNILMRPDENGEMAMYSVIDFGDTSISPLVFELAISIMYMMTKCTVIDPNLVAGHVIAGYQKFRPLPEVEFEFMKTAIAARYAQSLVMGAYSYSQDPGNEYLLVTAKKGWDQIEKFWDLPHEIMYEEWIKIMKSYEK